MPETRECAACGNDVTRSPSRFNGERAFCDKSCMSEGYDEGPVSTTCAYCGDDVEKRQVDYDNHDNHYCNNDCMYAHQRGENAPNWRGGVDKFSVSPEGKAWREQVFEDADYTCEDCGKTNCRLNAHHIEGRAENPDKKADPDNGKCLCLPCHAKTHFQTGEMGAYRLIKGNINRLDNV